MRVEVKVLVDLGGCQGDTRVVGGASDRSDILQKDRGRLPWRPAHGELQDLLHSLSEVADSFL